MNLVERGAVVASLMGVHLSDTDKQAMSSMDSMAEVNQYIYSKKEQGAKAPVLDPTIAKDLDKQLAGTHGDVVQAARRLADSRRLLSDLESRVANQVNILRRDYKAYRKLLESAKPDTRLSSSINRLLEQGYRLHNYSGRDVIELVTPFPIVCSYIDSSIGVHTSVSLGYFKYIYKVGGTDITVDVHSDNIIYDDYYHPHVNERGSVCWGTAINGVLKQLDDLDIAGAVTTLTQLLQQYNPSSPYVTLSELRLEKARTDLRGSPTEYTKVDRSMMSLLELEGDMVSFDSADSLDDLEDQHEFIRDGRCYYTLYVQVYTANKDIPVSDQVSVRNDRGVFNELHEYEDFQWGLR